MSTPALIGYVALCVVLPVGWGLLVVWGSNHVDRFLLRHRPHDASTSLSREDGRIEYHI